MSADFGALLAIHLNYSFDFNKERGMGLMLEEKGLVPDYKRLKL